MGRTFEHELLVNGSAFDLVVRSAQVSTVTAVAICYAAPAAAGVARTLVTQAGSAWSGLGQTTWTLGSPTPMLAVAGGSGTSIPLVLTGTQVQNAAMATTAITSLFMASRERDLYNELHGQMQQAERRRQEIMEQMQSNGHHLRERLDELDWMIHQLRLIIREFERRFGFG